MAEIEPPSLLTLTILGRELERSIGSSASITRQGPNRLTSIASATVARSALLAVAHRSYMVEALFTSTSVRPNRSFTQSAMAATLIELSTSSWHATIRFPSGSSSLVAISPLRRSRDPSTTSVGPDRDVPHGSHLAIRQARPWLKSAAIDHAMVTIGRRGP